MAIGTVKFFNTTKGFGFIIPEDGGKDIFVHKTSIELAGITNLSSTDVDSVALPSFSE